jgi:NAD(P)-dependent dehydrogenase (short-subunit alcohol dehydrogenase family)/pimeloyl-ACP methyl ester carboxylesterase
MSSVTSDDAGRARTSRVLASDGVRLAVSEYGDPAGRTILLVHGYPDTSSVWDPVVAILAPRFHVVTYDVRGAGASDRPRSRSAYRLDQLSRDLYAVLDAVSPDAPVHVVAHDWGSIQAWEAVTDEGAEQRIASYTSVSGPCLDHVAHWFRDRASIRPCALLQVVGQARRSWYIAVFHLPLVAPLAWRTFLGRGFGPAMRRIEGVPADPTYPAATLPLDGARGVQLYRANFLPRLRRPRIRRTSVPVQVVVPVEDRYVTAQLASGVDQWVDSAWVRPVRCGHWLPRAAPEVLAAAVEELVGFVESGVEPRTLRRLRSQRASHEQSRRGTRDYTDQLVVVTGAGSGIGRETARAFARRGAEVVIGDIDAVAAQSTAHLIRDQGGVAHPLVVDVSDVGAMERFARDVIDGHGVPDVVVNNAGIGIAGPMLDTTAADWRRIVDINLMGVVHGCRLFGAAMVERREGGHIVNIASAAAYTPSRTLSAYGATKAAVLMTSEALRAELAEHGIGVSAICPGIVNTNITTTTRFVGVSDEEQQQLRRTASRSYARRNYPPSKVAEAVVRAVSTNAAVVPVTPEAVGARLLSRLSPAAMRRLARLEVF